jgi:xanthine dehydrogenase YagT iron-sulfur-binding subunit
VQLTLRLLTLTELLLPRANKGSNLGTVWRFLQRRARPVCAILILHLAAAWSSAAARSFFSHRARRYMSTHERDTSEKPSEQSQKRPAMSRRKFVAGVGAITGFAVSGPISSRAGTLEPAVQAPTAAQSVPLELTINGTVHRLSVDPRVTLLDLLRENLGLTGSKKGCDHGQCGACTVLAEGRRINSCLSLAAVHDGEHITTVEGLATHNNTDLNPLQSAFLEHDGFQCGYCTPGQLCSASAMLNEFDRGDASVVTADVSIKPAELTPDEIRERMSGNICRCGAYPGIVAALQEVHQKRGDGQ